MISVYVNYPNRRITIHGSNGCAAIQQQHKEGQRRIALTAGTLSAELERFSRKFHKFGADQATNDMWLIVDFSDCGFERAVVDYVKKMLALHYTPFEGVAISEHCT